jgi:hypothetical protein
MRECTDAIMVSLAAVGLIVLITLSLALMMRIEVSELYFYYILILPPVVLTTYARLCLLEKGETSIVAALRKNSSRGKENE